MKTKNKAFTLIELLVVVTIIGILLTLFSTIFKASTIHFNSGGSSGSVSLPPSPPKYFNDFANIVSKSTAESLDERLTSLKDETTAQLVVAIYPKLEASDPVDHSQRTMRAWGVGQKGKNNGVTLFIYVNDANGKTPTVIQTGYGMEGALPDAICKDIIDTKIRPHIRAAKAGGGQKEWNAAVTEGVDAIVQAINKEYHIEGTSGLASKSAGASHITASEPATEFKTIITIIIIAVIILFILAVLFGGSSGYSSGGSYYSSGSSGSSGSSWGSSGGGGFSGGGGSCGGGGASGSD